MQKPNNSTLINVCVIPPKGVASQCVRLAQKLKADSTMSALDGKEKFAHMTLYMARFPDEAIEKVISSVEQALKGATRFACDHTGYFLTQGRYIEVSYQKTSQFLALQELLIDKVAPLRLNPGNPFEEAYFTPYTEEQRKNAQETGYDLARNLYRPHVTLARYKDDHVSEKFPGFATSKLSFVLAKVCVYKADDNGAVYEQLAEFTI